MKITQVEIVSNSQPIPLPEPWLPAWNSPGGRPSTSFGFSFYRLYTDEGIVGIGPNTGAPGNLVLGQNPLMVGDFWQRHQSGVRSGTSGKRAAGLEIACWDIIGKVAGLPIHQLLGAHRERLPVYAATSRLLEHQAHVDQVQELVELGFRAVKLRLHRSDPREDLAVVEAVRDAVGDGTQLLVDANQNNPSPGYNFWDRRTALVMARELDALGVYYLEEPLPRTDVEGLAEIAASVDMFIAGGEHAPTPFDFGEHLRVGAYDIIQPDVALMGNMGILGLRKSAELADAFVRRIVPHVCSGGRFPIDFAATLQAMATVSNCPLVEFPYDPPILCEATSQTLLREPIRVGDDGCVPVPSLPGLGIELDETHTVVTDFVE